MQQNEFSWKTPDGLNIYAKEWKPEGQVKASIALVHGLGEHIGRYDHVAEAFARAGFAMVGFDLRGHGRSDGVRGYTTSNAAVMGDISQVIQIAKTHFPDVPTFLYGHSLGGNLGLYYVLTQKADLKGAIITSPGLATAKPVPASLMLASKVLSVLAPKAKINNTLDLSGLSRDPSVAEKYKADPLVHPFISPRLAMDMFSNGDYCMQHAAEFPIPLLLMQGTEDRLVSPAKTKEFALAAPLSKVTHKEWPGFYHELHNEPEKADVIKTMIDWLNLELK
ncbi:MAG: alpha/beta hydrolase [Anaerolineaceae bacterium]|nr:alpha/beta hydrolase [Anaerolineaceae bacterium]